MKPTRFLVCLGVATLAIAAMPPLQAQPAPAAAASVPAGGQRDTARSARFRDWPGCIRDTGTHIPDKDRHCLGVPGRSYDRDDIRRTGATTIGGALDKLDPSISVRGR